MKYKVKLSPEVRNIAEWQLTNYKTEKQELEALKNDLIHFPVANYGEVSSGRVAVDSRPTERNTLLICSAPYLRRMETGINAVERALAVADPEVRQLVKLVYWDRTKSVEGAALDVNLSRSAAYEHLHVVLCFIAHELGFIRNI